MTPPRHRTIPTARRTIQSITLALLACATVAPTDAQVVRSPLDEPTPAVAPDARQTVPPASRQRWFEPSYGLSFDPPAGSTEVQNTRSGSLVTFALPGGFRIAVHLHETDDPITLRQAAAITLRQFASASPSAIELAPPDELIKPAGRPTLRLGFAVPAEDRMPAWVADLVLMKLDPTRFVVFQADLEAADFTPAAREFFHQFLRSVDVASLDTIDRGRVQLVETADQWAKGLDFDGLWDRLPRHAWFRLIRNGEEVGVRRLTFGRGREMGTPGYTLQVASHEVIGETELNTKAEFFLSERRDEELWSIETESRLLDPRTLPRVNVKPREDQPAVPVPIQAAKHVMTQTGVRSGGQLTVIRDSAEHADETAWPVPPVGYLSRIETELLAMVLLDGRPVRMQSYAYHGDAEDHSIALRTETTTQLDNGAWSINTRASLTSGWRNYLFDADGNLLQIDLADGGTLIPATAEQVRALYADRIDNAPQGNKAR
ncbi:MAG: hypothetical protein AAGI54_02150 [Planctomycetota bacterium]